MKFCLQCEKIFLSQDWKCPLCSFAPQMFHGRLSFCCPESRGGFRPEFFARLAKLEAGHFWFMWRNRLIIHTLRKSFPKLEEFLEIGCGTGFVLSAVAKAFPSAQVTGSEYFGEGLDFAAARLPQACFYQIDGRRLPFAEEFDVIGAFDMLEHIDDDDVVLAQTFRAVRPGGGIVLTVPQHRWLWSQTDVDACHVRRYTKKELILKMKTAGFRVEYVTSFVSLLLPVLALSRRLRAKSEGSDPLCELRLHPLLNTIFSMVMRLEFGLITLGLGLPAGGSLLVVGRKGKVIH